MLSAAAQPLCRHSPGTFPRRPPEGSKPNFTDVKAGAWYTGWVNAAESLGLVQGFNGEFRPNDSISNQEVITVLSRMLGYNDNLPGSWPTNYVTQAYKVDLLDDVEVVAAAPAKRGDVAVMLSNTLDANLVTYDKDTDEFVNKQTTKGGQDEDTITLLQDAFDGKFIEVTGFAAVDEVRDAAAGTLNWKGVDEKGSYGKGEEQDNYIIDADTRVSVNGKSLFDLAGHEGKIYYTIEGGKAYAKFIEVDSYKVAVSDQPKLEDGKIVVGKTKYTTVKGFTTDNISSDAQNNKKNSKFALYMNDDDQVYMVKSDLDDKDKAYFVKSVGTSTAKLIGNDTETIDADSDSLVWTGNGFITTEELEVGDAIVMIDGTDDLYVKTEAKSGVLKSATSTKWNIDGSEYVYGTAGILDDEYEDGAAAIEDIYGNTVQYLLNDDNSLAAIVVDEVSTGTKLYGIVVDGDESTGSWKQGALSSVSVFTAEGTVVEYDFDDDYQNASADEATELMGKLVEYKLNKDGEIKTMSVVTKTLLDGESVDVKNNAYLVGETNLTLANNVAIFEVDVDDNDIDVTLVTRAALLAEDDIKPGKLEKVAMGVDAEGKTNLQDINPYFVYVTNTNGAAKAIAYTNAGSTTKYYGVIDAFDYANADVDHGVTLVGDDNEYEFPVDADKNVVLTGKDGVKATDDDLLIYTKSGDKLTVEYAYADKQAAGLEKAKEVKGYVDGLITLTAAMTPDIDEEGKTNYTNVMTDSETVVYVINNKTGKYAEGTLDDISKGDMVYVPAIDDDGYADLVIVDEYGKYEAPAEGDDEDTDTTTTGGSVEGSAPAGE